MYRMIIITIFYLLTSCTSNLSDQELKLQYDEAIGLKNWRKSIELLDEAIKRSPKNIEAYYSRAIVKTNYTPNNLDEIISDLSIYLEDKNCQNKIARMTRFHAFFKRKDFEKAMSDINILIDENGKNPFLLSWKANCAFASKEFDVAERCYNERLKLRGTIEDLRNSYYYLILSKYFGGNKDGAIWDCAFLPDRGFMEDEEFMKMIMEDKLDFKNYINFQIPNLNLHELEALINNNCSDLDIFQGKNYYRSELLEQFAHLPRTENIKELLSNKEEVYSIDLSYSDLKELPKEIFQFINLQALNLSGNKFTDVEKLILNLSKLPNLKVLQLNSLKLKTLPQNIQLLANIEVLCLSQNKLKYLSEDIGKLSKLKLLSLRNNKTLKDLPKLIGDLRCLQRLDVSGTGLIRLREELSNCNELVSISANASKIKTLPINIGNLVNLKHLNLGYNKIMELPISIGTLKELQDLSLADNELKVLPKEISGLEKLGSISLEFNRFEKFPKELLVLKSMYSIWIHNNSIKEIPLEVAKMPKIERILVDHEVITDENITQLKEINPDMYVIKEDTRKYVKGKKRK